MFLCCFSVVYLYNIDVIRPSSLYYYITSKLGLIRLPLFSLNMSAKYFLRIVGFCTKSYIGRPELYTKRSFLNHYIFLIRNAKNKILFLNDFIILIRIPVSHILWYHFIRKTILFDHPLKKNSSKSISLAHILAPMLYVWWYTGRSRFIIYILCLRHSLSFSIIIIS